MSEHLLLPLQSTAYHPHRSAISFPLALGRRVLGVKLLHKNKIGHVDAKTRVTGGELLGGSSFYARLLVIYTITPFFSFSGFIATPRGAGPTGFAVRGGWPIAGKWSRVTARVPVAKSRDLHVHGTKIW